MASQWSTVSRVPSGDPFRTYQRAARGIRFAAQGLGRSGDAGITWRIPDRPPGGAGVGVAGPRRGSTWNPVSSTRVDAPHPQPFSPLRGEKGARPKSGSKPHAQRTGPGTLWVAVGVRAIGVIAFTRRVIGSRTNP